MIENPREVVIPKEDAVFWLDGEGYWRNDGGKFRNKKIIDFFHRAITRDQDGYYVRQERDGIVEKVYFPHEDTALFVFDLIAGDPVRLVLNTGMEMPLDAGKLYVRNDNLYIDDAAGEPVKFTVRAMMKLSKRIEESDDGRMFIRSGDEAREIEEKE